MNLRQLIDDSIREHGWFVQNVQHGEDEIRGILASIQIICGLKESY